MFHVQSKNNMFDFIYHPRPEIRASKFLFLGIMIVGILVHFPLDNKRRDTLRLPILLRQHYSILLSTEQSGMNLGEGGVENGADQS